MLQNEKFSKDLLLEAKIDTDFEEKGKRVLNLSVL